MSKTKKTEILITAEDISTSSRIVVGAYSDELAAALATLLDAIIGTCGPNKNVCLALAIFKMAMIGRELPHSKGRQLAAKAFRDLADMVESTDVEVN